MTENQKRRFEDRIQAKPLDWNDAQPEQSSTAGAAKGGNTSDNGSQASSVLTDERIIEIFNHCDESISTVGFARAIEAEVLAQAGVRAEPAAPALSAEPDVLEVVRLAVSSTLHSHRVTHLLDEDDQPYPLVDLLSKEAPDTIATGKAEIERIIDAICDEFQSISKSFAAPTTPAQVPAAEVRALEQRLDEMQAIIWAGSKWNGNEQEFADKSESDVAMLDDLLSDAFRKLRSLAQSSTADKASEVRASNPVTSQAALDVLAERRRQIEQEGWTPEHDDKYSNCELARAAATYALCSHIEQLKLCGERVWPWHPDWWKRTTYRRDLIKAGSLILAEVERIDRAAAPSTADSGNTDEKGNDHA